MSERANEQKSKFPKMLLNSTPTTKVSEWLNNPLELGMYGGSHEKYIGVIFSRQQTNF